VDATPSSFEFAATNHIELVIIEGFPSEFSQKLLLVWTQQRRGHCSHHVLEPAKKGSS
jgi:hypothetical protein